MWLISFRRRWWPSDALEFWDAQTEVIKPRELSRERHRNENEVVFFFLVLLRNIDIYHYKSLRCAAWWFDLHILWNDYHNRFYLASIISCRYNKRKREKKIFLMRTLRICSLNSFPRYHVGMLTIIITL